MGKLDNALNQQMNNELQAFYFYLSLSAYFGERNLSGIQSWLKAQAEEEMSQL